MSRILRKENKVEPDRIDEIIQTLDEQNNGNSNVVQVTFLI